MKSPLVVTSIGIHIVALAALLVAGFWKLDRLEPGRQSIDLAVMSSPAAAASGSPAAAKVQTFKRKRLRVTKELVQPTKLDHDVQPAAPASEVGTGTGGTGSGAGSGSGNDPDGAGTCTIPPCGDGKPAAEPALRRPLIVPPSVIKGLRIAGETQIVPPAPVKTAILRDGHKRVVAVFRVCVGQRGEISSLHVQKSSGYPAYDAALDEGLRGWRYRPYALGGRAVAVCGVVTFIYSIQ